MKIILLTKLWPLIDFSKCFFFLLHELFSNYNSYRNKYYHDPHLIDAETEIQNSYITCQRFQLASGRVRIASPALSCEGYIPYH